MLGENIKQLRENANMYQKELAQVLNVTSQTISGWEINRTAPDYETLVKIANYFGVSTDYLLNNQKEASEYENELHEKEALKKALIKSGYMKDGEDLSNDELKKLMEFIKINKKYIKDCK